jgi:hypothetical protein
MSKLTIELYSFQTKLFCIIVLEVRSFVGTDWLLRGPILLKSSLHDVNVKVLILKFMFYLTSRKTCLLRSIPVRRLSLVTGW